MQDKRLIHFYGTMRRGGVAKSKTLPQLFSYIREEEGMKSLFNQGLATWKKDDPARYAVAKANMESIYIGTSDTKYNSLPVWNGLVQLDIDDNNTKEEYDKFRADVSNGKVPYIKGLSWSASGPVTGAMWIVCEFELDRDKIDNYGRFADTDIHKIHKNAYRKAIDLVSLRLKEDYGIIPGDNSKKLKQLRFVVHDPDAYYTEDNAKFTTEELLDFAEDTKEADIIKTTKKRIKQYNKIQGTDWKSMCLRYVADNNDENKDLQEDGRKMSAYYWGVWSNMLGIPVQDAQEGFAEEFGVNSARYMAQVASPYDTGEKFFGVYAHKLLHEEYEELRLPEGEEYLTYYQDTIIKALEEHKKVSLIAPTNCGKNYFTCKVLAPQYDGITILVLSLNKKVFKDAVKYNCKYPLTHEHVVQAMDRGATREAYLHQVVNQKLIICNADQSNLLMTTLSVMRPEAKVQLVVDESQTFAKSFREGAYNKLFQAFNSDQVERVLFMTGTPIVGFKKLGFKLIKVNKNKAKINVTIKRKGKNVITNIIEELEESKNRAAVSNKRDTLIMRINNKETIEEVATYLIDTNILQADEVVKIYRGQDEKEVEEYAEQLNNATEDGESFKDPVKLVLATAQIEEGIDIYTQGNILTIMVEDRGTLRPDSLVQVMDRWRTNNPKDGVLYIPSLLDPKGFMNYNPLTELNNREACVDSMVLALNMQPEDIRGGTALNIPGIFNREIQLINWNTRTNQYEPKFASILGYIYDTYYNLCTVSEAVQYFAVNYDYLVFSFEDFDADRQEASEDYLQIQLSRQEEIELNKNNFTEMNESEFKIMSALIKATLENNNELLSRLNIDPLTSEERIKMAKMKKQVEKILDDPTGLKMAKKVMGCCLDVIDLGFTHEDAHLIARDPDGNDSFVFSRVDKFVSGYKQHKLFEEADRNTLNLNRIQNLQVEQYSKISEQFIPGQQYTLNEVMVLSKEVLKKNEKQYMSFNKSACVSFVEAMFITERVRGTRGAQSIKIKDYETLDGFCTRYGLNKPVSIFDLAADSGVEFDKKW